MINGGYLFGSRGLGISSNPVGVLSEQDCMKVALSVGDHDDFGGLVNDFMSPKVITIDADMSILRLALLFIDSPYRRFPVIQNNRLMGQISRLDVLRALGRMG
jgi:predicted transcriptional regulator